MRFAGYSSLLLILASGCAQPYLNSHIETVNTEYRQLEDYVYALEEENARLTEETAEVKRQLETRKVVERAKGILQRRQSLTEEEAYLRMRNESRRLRRPMKDLAEAIILAEELGRKEPAARD